MQRKMLTIIVVPAFWALSCVAQPSPTPAGAGEAEKVAQNYMTAFFHNDLRRAATLTHPKTLQQTKVAFTKEWDKAKTEGKEAEFLKKSGVEERSDLRSLGPIDFYVVVLEVSGVRLRKLPPP